MKLISQLTSAIIITQSVSAQAASGWDDHATTTMYFQILNITVLFGALIYFLKDSAREHFKTRALSYHAEAIKAQNMLKEAQNKLDQLQSELTKIETTWATSLSRAHADAVELRNQLNQQAQEATKRMILDAQRAIQAEQNGQYRGFIADLIKIATVQVEQRLKTQLSEEDHKRLQKNFGKSVSGAPL